MGVARGRGATVDALVRTIGVPGPRAPVSTEQLAASVAEPDPCPEEGAPLEQVLVDLEPLRTRGRSRTCIPRR